MRVGPVLRDDSSVPADECVGLHDEDCPSVTPECSGERAEQHAVGRFEPGPRHLTVQHGELMAEHEDLGVFGAVASTAKHEEIQHQADKTVETASHAAILSALRGSDHDPRTPAQHARTDFRHPQAGPSEILLLSDEGVSCGFAGSE